MKTGDHDRLGPEDETFLLPVSKRSNVKRMINFSYVILRSLIDSDSQALRPLKLHI